MKVMGHLLGSLLRSFAVRLSQAAWTVVVTVVVLVPGCKDEKPSNAQTLQPPELPADLAQRLAFVDGTNDAGLSAAPVQNSIAPPKRMLGGLSAADIDDDGDVDLAIVYPSDRGFLLFANDGGFFRDITGTHVDDPLLPGAAGALWIDEDGDDDLDLVVVSYANETPRFFRQTNGRWTKEPLAFAGLRYAVSPTAGDVNGDGWLDLFVSHWNVNIDVFFGDGDIEGDLTYLLLGSPNGWVEAAPEVGLTENSLLYSFSGHFLDVTGDSLPELLVASDFGFSRIFENNGGSQFTDLETELTDQHGMGSALIDFDNDGDQDWFVTSIAAPPEYADLPEAAEYTGNRLYRNDGEGRFVDVSETAFVRDGGWGWGACAADFDNDGLVDLFHVNGFEPELGQNLDLFLDDASRLFLNLGDGRFIDVAPHVGLVDHDQGRGVACFDHDRDGDVDIMVMNYQAPLRLWRNEAPARNRYLEVSLRAPSPNTRAIGASIEVRAGSLVQTRVVAAGNGFIGQQPDEVHFGLSENSNVDELRVTWPDGSVTVQHDVATNQRIVVRP